MLKFYINLQVGFRLNFHPLTQLCAFIYGALFQEKRNCCLKSQFEDIPFMIFPFIFSRLFTQIWEAKIHLLSNYCSDFAENFIYQDETEVFSALFMVGQNHGKFLVSLINEVSQMVSMDPCMIQYVSFFFFKVPVHQFKMILYGQFQKCMWSFFVCCRCYEFYISAFSTN